MYRNKMSKWLKKKILRIKEQSNDTQKLKKKKEFGKSEEIKKLGKSKEIKKFGKAEENEKKNWINAKLKIKKIFCNFSLFQFTL